MLAKIHLILSYPTLSPQAVDKFPKGPTLFEPVIHKAVQLARCPNPPGVQRYVVLLVLTDGPLTDGQFSDRQKTIDAVLEASQLPLSIMFVGVGDDPVCVVPHSAPYHFIHPFIVPHPVFS